MSDLICISHDVMNMENNIEKLRKKLTKSKNSKDLISNYGYKKYLTIENSKIELNEDKIKEQEKWDGIFTCITNHKDLKPIEIISQYKNLWQIEETFRISKHNLKFRPIYHHSSKRIVPQGPPSITHQESPRSVRI